jgi:hypothetical protein
MVEQIPLSSVVWNLGILQSLRAVGGVAYPDLAVDK